ncbi:hypothetical protein [Mesorhizobium sp. WSM2239]|uniref:Uncharacterized protein n=2 Tax=unclassified Mesorhizobium TaxID=325217 RepID=A0AAU8DCL3_9HYPH
MNLKYSEVYRGGITSPYISLETKNISITPLEKDLRIAFSIASKGGGTTRVRVDIDRRDFQAMIREMMDVDRSVAMKAVSEELAREIAREPEVEQKAEQRGRQQVKELARDKYLKAPVGADEKEKLISDETANLVDELNSDDKRSAA